ncbi:Innexin, partial [Trinorchestia longiramus]
MFQFFGDLKNQFAFKNEHPNIDSGVFKSMKLATVSSLLACMLVTAKTYIGDNINCVTGFGGNEQKAIETYCFISSTFSLINLTDANAPYPGLGPMPAPDGGGEDPLKRHAYYQWVPMMLAIQTAVLMFPHWLWKNAIDRTKFKSILSGLDKLHLNDEAGVQK